jgi:hypothetical protein
MMRRHRALHLRIWLVLALVLPAVLLGAALLRRDRIGEPQAVLLAPVRP